VDEDDGRYGSLGGHGFSSAVEPKGASTRDANRNGFSGHGDLVSRACARESRMPKRPEDRRQRRVKRNPGLRAIAFLEDRQPCWTHGRARFPAGRPRLRRPKVGRTPAARGGDKQVRRWWLRTCASWGQEDMDEARRAVAQFVADCRADEAPEPVTWNFAEEIAQPPAIKAKVHDPCGDIDEV
jgi:hypothetical protein